jgi:hypothetical protein
MSTRIAATLTKPTQISKSTGKREETSGTFDRHTGECASVESGGCDVSETFVAMEIEEVYMTVTGENRAKDDDRYASSTSGA